MNGFATIIARRHDMMCGRLTATTHGQVVADHFSADFRFTWPNSTVYTNICGTDELFSQAFIDSHFMDEASCARRKSDAVLDEQHALDESRSDTLFVMSLNDRTVEKYLGKEISSYPDFMPLDNFSDDCRRIYEFCQSLPPFDAIHIRHGDLVRGEWRHFGHVHRFLPHDAVAYLLKCSELSDHAYVFSDEPDAAQRLSQDLGNVAPSSDLHGRLPAIAIRRDIKDLFSMAAARTVHGPSSSAFSNYAAKMSGSVKNNLGTKALETWAIEQMSMSPLRSDDAFYDAKRLMFMVEVVNANPDLKNTHSAAMRRTVSESISIDPSNALPHKFNLMFSLADGNYDTSISHIDSYLRMLQGLHNAYQMRGRREMLAVVNDHALNGAQESSRFQQSVPHMRDLLTPN